MTDDLSGKLIELADKLQRPDPWMQGDDYGEGYTDGKAAAGRLLRALVTEAGGAERFDAEPHEFTPWWSRNPVLCSVCGDLETEH